MTNPLDAWVDELSTALDVDPAATDVQLVLDLARDAAHAVTRPAAPLTTFLVGLAAGLGGADRADVTAAATTAQRLLAARDQATSSGSE